MSRRSRSGDSKPFAPDRDPKPGQITSAIIASLIQARLVIADLTGKNANVYYELAVAHAFGRPVAILADHVDELSFDVGHERVVEIRDNGVRLRKDQKSLLAQP